MLRTDTANFNRFLTSVGLLLLAAALVVPYFYFQNTETLEIPASDLRLMTETGRDALTGRQDAIASLEVWVVVMAIALAIIGIVLVVWGGARLRATQESDDEETALRKKRAELEVREMSPDEKVEQANEKARTEVAQEITATRSSDRADAVRSSDVSEQRVLDSWNVRRRAITRISARIEEVFSDRALPNHKAKWGVRIGSAIEEIRLDGLFESTADGVEDLVLETRVSPAPETLRKSAGSTAHELIARLSRYQALTGRPAKGWLVIVVPMESEQKFDAATNARALDSVQVLLQPFGRATLLNEQKLDSLPEQFLELFGSA